MQDENERRSSDGNNAGEEDTRPQQGGEGGTTRFGMEDGDNSDIPATGGPDEDEAAERSR